MGKPGAKKMDQIVSVTPGDVHIIMVPSPGGPVPTPIPHPCASIIKDKVAEKVKVMGQPGAVKGSISKHTPPHIPMGPGPFQKPPANKGEIVTASSNVFYEGKEAAMLGDTAKMCADPADAPVGKVIGTAATVLVGGGGSGSDEARAAAADAAMKAAAAVCHKWINANMPPGADREQAHRDVCTATGHPIDVVTGKMFTRNIDLKLHGRIPFEFVRNYSSARSDIGVFGHSWRHSYEIQLVVHRDFVAHRDPNGRFLPFESIPIGGQSLNKLGRLTLRRIPEGYIITAADGGTQFFPFVGKPHDVGIMVPIGRIADRFGNRLWFDYTNGKLVHIEDTARRIISFDYNQQGFICALCFMPHPEADTFETIRAYRYSDENDLVEVHDEMGRPYRFEYSNHLLVRETDRCGFSFYFTYDKEGWCQQTWGDGGLLYRRLEYDRKCFRTQVTNSFGHITTYQGNEFGVVTMESDDQNRSWSFEYNDSLLQVRAVDPLGNTWSYEYDENGKVVLGEDPEGLTFAYEYTRDGRNKKYADRGGNVWQSDYNDERFATRLLDPLGRATLQQQNEHGDLAVVYHPDGSATRLFYDHQGLPVRIEHVGGLVVRRTYSATGELLTEDDDFGVRLQLEYDRLRRLRSVWKRGAGLTTREYDAEGRLVQIVQGDGAITEYRYAHLNRVERVVHAEIELADGTRYRPSRLYEYDTEGRVKSLTLPGGEVVHYEYATAQSNPTAIRYPDGRVQRVERDARGFVRRLEENGVWVFEQDTDSAGRVVRRLTSDGDEQTFEYDPQGRLVATTNDVGRAEVERDALGRILAESGPEGTIRRTYGKQGVLRTDGIENEIELELIDSPVAGQLCWRLRGGAGAVELTYDRVGRVIREAFDHGVVREAVYDDGDVPYLQTIHARTRRTLGEERDHLDGAGRVAVIERDGREVARYSRDALGRLSQAVGRRGVQELTAVWGFDRAGNRVVQSDLEGEPIHCSYGPGHRLEAFGENRLCYDERGRVVRWEDSSGLRGEYVWDAMGRLLQVRDARGPVATMRYDALGKRVSKTTAEGTTTFVWAGNQMVHERRPNGEARHYLYHSDSYRPLMLLRRAAPDESWETYAFVNDCRGCPEALLGRDGELVWSAEVSPWGLTRVDPGSRLDQPLAMPGQYRDAETGLSYNRHRYYLPAIGAYISPDPLGVDGGDSVYAYVDDPITWFDPLGLAMDDYTPEQKGLVRYCGDPQPPTEIRPGEFDMTPDGGIRVAQPGQPMELDPNVSHKYLYVVGEDGRIYYAAQDTTFAHHGIESVKHTTLAGEDPNFPGEARNMRVGGELTYDEKRDVWTMDGKSGRYSSDGTNATRHPGNVQAARELNQSFATPDKPSPNIEVADKPFW
jgi:RHS repeat-associated protein